MTRELFDRQRERWAYVRRSDAVNDKLVIFVHGFRGSYLSTWGDLANFLQKHSESHTVLAQWDYLFVGYETYSIGSFLDIADIIITKWRDASTRAPPFDQNSYSKLALVGHSLGTLGIRQLLCAMSEQPSGMLDALKATVLFGSPLNGSSLAGIAGLAPIGDLFLGKPAALLPGAYKIARALQPDSSELKMLQTWNKTIRNFGKGTFGPSNVILGTDDHVVGTGGLAKWEGDVESKTAMSHSQMVKTIGVTATTQGAVLDVLKGLGNGQ